MATAPAWRSWVTVTGRRRTLMLVLATVLGVAAVGHLVVQRVTALPEDAVLQVRGDVLTESAFQQRENMLVGLYGASAPPDGPEADRFRRDTAQAVATSMVVDQHAATGGLVAPEPDVDNALRTVLAGGRFAQSPGGAAQVLSSLRISEDDLREEIRRQLTQSRVYDQVTAGAPAVTDQDVAAAYEQRRGAMAVPERRHLRNIVVDDPDLANQVLAQARAGADFTALAAQSSRDKSTSGNGGDLGVVDAGTLEKPVGDAAFAAPAGTFFGPVASRHGWNVGQVLEVAPASVPTLDQVREPLRAQLTEERRLDRWRPWLADQVREAGVEYTDRYRPADPDGLPADLPR